MAFEFFHAKYFPEYKRQIIIQIQDFIQRKAEGSGDEQIHFAPKMVYPLYEADSQTVQAAAGLSQ